MTKPLDETNRMVLDDIRARVRVLASFVEIIAEHAKEQDARIARQDAQMLRLVGILRQSAPQPEPHGVECRVCGYRRTVFAVCPHGCDTSELRRRASRYMYVDLAAPRRSR